mgnify:CR=1 FL=1|jgi:hypothetical protein
MILNKKLNLKIKKRINKLLKIQKGGGPREFNFSTDGNFGNLVNQIGNLFTNAIAGITDGVEAAVSVIEAPYNLGHDISRPNEPLPQNTPIYHVIDKT